MNKPYSIRVFSPFGGQGADINHRLYLRAFFREIEAQYQILCNHDTCNGPTAISELPKAISIENYTKLIEELAQQIQSGKLKPSDLDSRLVEQIYNDVSQPVKNEFGEKWVNYDYKEPGSLIQKFKKNLWQFSSAKTLAELEYINALILDKNGRIKPEHQFMQDVRKSNILFNRNYLQAEYQTAKRGAQMAHLWAKFQEQKHLFPNLVYRTVGDSRVRPEHATLNGVIKPIDDPFWRTYYPPNGWRCRCTVMNTAEKASEGEFEDKSVKPEFHGNTALDEEILTSKGSFFKLLNKDHKAKINAELLKYNAPLDIAYHGKNKKKVFVSPFADDKDLIPNVETAMVIVDKLGIDVKIRAHIDSNIVKGHKNPEYEINGKIADRKEVSSYTSIRSNLDTARKQGNQSIVYDITNFKNWNAYEITKNLKGKIMNFKNKNWLHDIYLVNGNKAISFTKDELLNDFDKVFKLFKQLQ